MNDQNYYFKQTGDMIDISSTTQKPPVSPAINRKDTNSYGGGISKSLGIIIKIISFVVAFASVAIGGVGCLLIRNFFDSFFDSIAIAVFILAVVIGTISLFIIYGIGHVICQNNEILKRMNEKE